MIYKVEFTTGARQDLLNIYRYIKNAGRPETARRLSEKISNASISLSQFPERGHIPSELEGLGTSYCRQIIVKPYRIIYQILGDVVLIHGIIHGRRGIRETMEQRILV